MTVFLYILLAIIVILAAIVIYAATKPNSFKIERSATIAARPEAVFNVIGDFANFEKWSPWNALDPNLKLTLSGKPDQVGAIYAWEGNKKVGAGRQEILSKTPYSRIDVKIDFFRPMKATNDIAYLLEPAGEGTKITWSMGGPTPLMSKIFGLFFDIDKMVGKDFEKGLTNLKTLCEKVD